MPQSTRPRDLSPAAVRDMMQERSCVLIDVREPAEAAAERIRGALLFPLSTFDPAALPAPDTCRIVFHCGTGKRSAMAIAQCLAHGIEHTAHMAGGLQAWKAAGLPTIAAGDAGATGGR